MTWLKKNCATVSTMLLYVGMAFAHLVKQSTINTMYLWLLDDVGLQVMKSMPHLKKGSTMMTRCTGAGGALSL